MSIEKGNSIVVLLLMYLSTNFRNVINGQVFSLAQKIPSNYIYI